MVTEFTPFSALAGGILIGLSSMLLLLLNGRIAGISGIASRLIVPPYVKSELGWEISFIIGLLIAPVAYFYVTDLPIQQAVTSNLPLLAIAGLLVGFGSVLGNGCTSGHGVCGISRISVRSIAATLTFMATGFVTVFVLRHVVGG